jgi:hypothetical protein
MSTLLLRKLSAGRGLAWLQEGLMLFRRGPLGFVAAFALFLLAVMLLMSLPYAGGAIAHLLTPVVTAGLFSGCHALAGGQLFHVGHLAVGFRQRAVPLITVGGIYLVGNIIINQAMNITSGGAMEQMLAEMIKPHPDLEILRTLTPEVLPAATVGLLLLTPLLLATWFAPALILFDDMPPLVSMGTSLRACILNLGAFTLYGLASGLILLLGLVVPLGLGLLMVGPWLTASTYAAYRDIFRPVEQKETDGKFKQDEESTS